VRSSEGFAKTGDVRMMKLTIFVRVLNTRIVPADVPMKTYLPDGSNRATVIADLVKVSETSIA